MSRWRTGRGRCAVLIALLVLASVLAVSCATAPDGSITALPPIESDPGPLPSANPEPTPKPSAAPAADAAAATAGSGSGSAVPSSLAPEPYRPEEFPDLLKGARRFEVVAVGAFPFAYLYANLFYDVGRYAVKAIGAQIEPRNTAYSDYAKYAPMFFAPSNKPKNTQDETVGLLVTSIGVAFGVALGDLIIGLVEGTYVGGSGNP